MFKKTSSIPFLKFGEVFHKIPGDALSSDVKSASMDLVQNSFNSLYCLDSPCYIQAINGASLLVVTDDMNKPFEEFVIHRVVKINKGIYFNVLPLGSSATVTMTLLPDTHIQAAFLSEPYSTHPLVPRLHIDELIAWFYNVRGQNYHYAGGTERYWELTYVDSGQLQTSVNSESYTIRNNEFMFYMPGDSCTQSTEDSACSYLTVMFAMDVTDEVKEALAGKVFPVSQEIRHDLEAFVKPVTSTYTRQLLVNSLQHLVLTLLEESSRPAKPMSTPMQQKFENELLNEILLYINEHVYEAFNVEDLCREFAISRSSLQALFTANLGVAPKQFISTMKLRRSRLLIKESKYTISEIAAMLGYSSIHYFSRKFKMEYGMTPSEYANKLMS